MEYFPGFTSIEILRKTQEDLEAPEQFDGMILFMSMFNDTDWTKHGHSLDTISNPKEVRVYVKSVQRGQ